VSCNAQWAGEEPKISSRQLLNACVISCQPSSRTAPDAGHTSAITGLAFSYDGKYLASASADKTAKIWDPITGALLMTLEGHTAVRTHLVVFRHSVQMGAPGGTGFSCLSVN
jgi:WD40 repeat protein